MVRVGQKWSEVVEHTTSHRSKFKEFRVRLSHVDTGNGLLTSYAFIRAIVYGCIMSGYQYMTRNVEKTEVGRFNMGYLE